MADKVPDLDTVLKMWAWTAYLTARGESQYGHDDVQLRVIWDVVASETRYPEFSNGRTNTDPSPLVLRTSTYENISGETQEHQFKASGQTTSFVTTDLTKGITWSAGFKIHLPSEVQAMLGQETILNEDGHVTRKTQTWNSETKIQVAPKKQTLVRCEVTQKSYECDFKCELLLNGKVRVNIVHLETGSLLMVVENDLTTVLKDIIHADEESAEYLGVHFDGNTAVWAMAGHVHFLYGTGEIIKVECENLPRSRE